MGDSEFQVVKNAWYMETLFPFNVYIIIGRFSNYFQRALATNSVRKWRRLERRKVARDFSKIGRKSRGISRHPIDDPVMNYIARFLQNG